MILDFLSRYAFGTILVLVVWVITVVTIANIVMRSRSAAGAWGWSMSVVTLPFLAVPLYWIFGRQRFRGYMEELVKAKEENEEFFDELLASMSPHFAELDEDQCEYAGVLERFSERRFTRGNEVCLLIDGRDTFDAIFDGIRTAKEYVLVQFFIFRNDDLSHRFRDLLLEKAKEGVRIYFLYDEIGSYSLKKEYTETLKSAGVEVNAFHSTQGKANRFQINFRNHRKIVVVDGKLGFVGGHNVGDEYLGLNTKYGRWRDTHVKVVGPGVLSLQMVWLSDWYWATRRIPKLAWKMEIPPEEAMCGNPDMVALALPTGPVESMEGGTMFFLNTINTAKRRLWMASPYFVTDEGTRSALQLAALRGVDVRIMIPANPDKLLPYLASFSYLEEMEEAGVKILRYADGFLHQKVILVDDDWASVGTANLDNRSMRLNFEVSMVVLDSRFAKQVEQMLEIDFQECKLATARDFTEKPLYQRFAMRAARLAAPLL